MDYKEGFNKDAFEHDHFGFKRGYREKYYYSWQDIRYDFGLNLHTCNERDLTDGKMSKALYDNLCRVYGRDEMDRYFPQPETEKKRKPLLHFSPTSIMANGVGGTTADPADRMKRLSGKGGNPMTDEELDELATLLCGSAADVSAMKRQKRNP